MRLPLLLGSVFVVTARQNATLGRLPPLGWNTWCTWSSCHQNNKSLTHAFHDVCTEEMVKDVAQSMIDQGLQKAGYHWVNLDDCWEATSRDPETGAMRADSDRFPSGTLKPLADWLHARNFSFGMYTSAGNQTCSTGGRIYPDLPVQPRGVNGSWGHYAQDAHTYASWGVDYVKLDWCTKYPNRSELTTQFREALDRSGREMWLNFHCDGAYKDWCAEDGNSWRIGPDHHDVWDNTKDVISILATVNENNQTGPYKWADPDFLMTGGAGCDMNATAVRCPGQSEHEYRTEMSLWSLGAAQILVATDLRQMTPFMREVLLHEEILAIHQDPLARPGGRIAYAAEPTVADALPSAVCAVKLSKQTSHSGCIEGRTFGCFEGNRSMWISDGCRGVFECDGVADVSCDHPHVAAGRFVCPCAHKPPPVPSPVNAEVWVRELSGGAMAVGLFNGGGKPRNITADIAQVWRGYSGRATRTSSDASPAASASANVRDVWQRKDLGLFTETFTAQDVGVHETRVYKFTK